jgi:UDP-N-acetylmuramoyl-L-alanyl-D-glutamate--2,6-diaminopimelate ligase
MKRLDHILQGVRVLRMEGDATRSINELRFDSRTVSKGDVFFAIQGTTADGHEFIPQAVEKGAVAIVMDGALPAEAISSVTWCLVENSSKALAMAAHNYFDRPSGKLKLVGITGTNGKTTVATLLYQLFNELNPPAGLLSTVAVRIGDEVRKATHTTPDPVTINSNLADMVRLGCNHCFMEVSSHAVVQHRTYGLEFSGGVFTNITHDHLDYHITFNDYVSAKKAFFDQLSSTAFALVNADDKRGNIMLQNTQATRKSFSMRGIGDFRGKVMENTFTGLVMKVNGHELNAMLVGHFNAYNVLCAHATAVMLGIDERESLRVLSSLHGAEGRFERLASPSGRVIGIVDYAHTPDALKNVLQTIREIRKGSETVITVVGCGGDRDKTKRPIMGQVACQLSEKVILTSDNPRSEDPAAILEEMRHDLPPHLARKAVTIGDRREAIHTAVQFAEPGDIILVAGKGHESYQEIKGERFPFDDRRVLAEAFEEYGK